MESGCLTLHSCFSREARAIRMAAERLVSNAALAQAAPVCGYESAGPYDALSDLSATSAASIVAVQLARRSSASADFEPGSAVYVRRARPLSADTSSISYVRLRSPTTGWWNSLAPVRWMRTL